MSDEALDRLWAEAEERGRNAPGSISLMVASPGRRTDIVLRDLEPPVTPSRPLHFRQGDVLLLAVQGLPDGADPERRSGRIVLAEGEATGHAHAIAEPDARAFTHEGQRYLLTKSIAQLVHEEHAPIEVPPGTWRVVIQREYEPPVTATAPAWRRVVD